ncbi:MAG: M3 family oligoendopeptidase [Nitrospirota bacterium]|nr:M3 family oligoendopeptidase [Nitrospirota bacterium]
MTEHTARGVTWDLTDLYGSPADPRIDADLERLQADALAFETCWRGHISGKHNHGIQAAELITLLSQLEEIWQGAGVLSAFSYLIFAADTANPAHGALLTRVRERLTDLRSHLLFVELEWAALPEATARPLLDDPRLARFRHHLIRERDFTPHRRSEAEEIILDQKTNTGSQAFARLFDETLARARFTVTLEAGPKEMSEQEALALLANPDRPTRKAAADALTAGLAELAPLLIFIYNTLIADHSTDTRIRSFGGPMAERNLANEISQGAVDSLMTSCERALPMVADYYRIKGRLLGLEPLYDYDRYAPLVGGGEIPFSEARKIVLESFGAFSPRMAEIAHMFFENRWIDAETRPGKRGGAFAHPVTPSRHPFVLMNYLGHPRDVMTLAHELGHGIHQWLARERGYFGSSTPLTTAETASVFGEMLVFSTLRRKLAGTPEALPLLCGKLEDTFSTVFRQVVMTRFEQAAHAARATEGELTGERLNALWMEVNRPMFGDALHLRDDYANWWSYIPHFIHTPFYCYAYAFGELLVLALYARYLEEGETFVPRYLELLAGGGSDRPEALLKCAGVDIGAPGFWDGGLAVIRSWVDEARELGVPARTG